MTRDWRCEQGFRMLSVEQCRRLLGKRGQSLTEDQVRRLRDELYGLAHVAFSIFIEQQGTKEAGGDTEGGYLLPRVNQGTGHQPVLTGPTEGL